MKKTFQYILFVLLAAGLFACNQPKSNENTSDEMLFSREEMASIEASIDSFMRAEDHWQWPDSVKNILLIPDSILRNDSIMSDPNLDRTKYWTPQQRELNKAIMKVYIENLKPEGNQIIIDISREDFIKKGIPEVYYDDMVQNIKYMNFTNKVYRMSPEKMATQWETMRQEFKKKFGE